MSFDEWLDTVERVPDSKLDNLLRLVRAQRKMLAMADLAEWHDFPSQAEAWSDLDAEIIALEAALMNIVP